MHVQGKYNASKKGFIFVVGNGTKNDPSDAYRLDNKGNAWFAGDATTAEGYSLNNIGQICNAEGNGQRRPVIYYDTNTQFPANAKNGDIYCHIIE
jgi:hypothetical protein